MTVFVPDPTLDTTFASAPGGSRARAEVPEAERWNLADIFPSWEAWKAAFDDLEGRVRGYATRKGTLASGPGALLEALRESDTMGQLAYKVWYFASLAHDEDQRDNAVGARRQQVQLLFAQWRQATAWFNPELLAVPLDTLRAWMDADAGLAVYRFMIENLFRQQEHVLDERGEHLLSLAAQLTRVPDDAYEALSTADMRFPTIELSTGEQVQVTYPRYRALLATNRVQADRARAFEAHHGAFEASINTYAALYNGVLQRDWYQARARGYATTLEAALHGDNIPVAVVENLIASARANVGAFQRYEKLRRRALKLDTYHLYDGSIPLVDFREHYPYEQVVAWIVESVAPLGPTYQQRLADGFARRWVDIYENDGKRSGAYSAPVYGVHPYVLMNYNDTLDAAFTLAHEMGHSMHTVLSHERQPFVYSDYTIFVAEVPSTLSEALLLDYRLAHATDPLERIVLLQHAIDGITGTFFTQVMFADWELQAHRLVEAGEPVTADGLSALYDQTLRAYHGDAIDYDALSRVTWARIPHFFGSPYYVYQYATCYATSARLLVGLRDGDPAVREATIARYLELLAAGGSDYPMALLQQAGIDLAEPSTVGAVATLLDTLVDQLEEALGTRGLL
ncbi:oligoendopeptidase F [Luteitalea sp. TBR-22]|uniref:oligoendopeptidase F n=1 Tax=Luteitalea sp. TBR-22 TaxID=2802971 RepID=UPI001AF202A3|nr:oligoendopeptidase F [Luteitalea sp. TBR-22]BCS33466.1 oligoendopeptidase F [Luteitalea sp. TBR-22]